MGFKERLTKKNYINPVEFRIVQNAIFLPILIIVLSFISYLFVDEFNNTKNITRNKLSIILEYSNNFLFTHFHEQ